MLFQWIDHPSLTREDQLLGVLYDLGMATAQQLLEITGLAKNNLNMILMRIRKHSAAHEEEWIRSYYTPARGTRSKAVYTLGKDGIRRVHDVRNISDRVKEAPAVQMAHYMGINNILCRCLKEFPGKEIQWYSSYEVAELLLMRLNDSRAGANLRNIIRPDGRMRIGEIDLLIEFDNDTEGPQKLETKYRRYVELYQELGLKQPILWVTINERRRKYLEDNWRALSEIVYGGNTSLPEMKFFVEGEELTTIKGLDRVGGRQ